MSDDDDENKEHPGMMFLPMPAEQQAELRRQHDLAVQQGDELRASIERMLDEMPVDHLWTLKRTFSYGTGSDGNDLMHFLQGQITAIMRVKHNACTKCGDAGHVTSLHGLDMNNEAGLREDPDGPF